MSVAEQKGKKNRKKQIKENEDNTTLDMQKPEKKYWGIFLAGFLWGITFFFIFGIIFLRHSLIYEYESKLSLDETVAQIKINAEKNKGWIVQLDSGCKMPKIKDGSRITILKLCHGQYGSQLLNGEDTRKTSAIIPCTFAVYEKNGKTYLSRINVSLVGQLLGGNASRIFSSKVSPEQENILEGVVK